MSPPTGYIAFVLHAHLPFIRHPEYPDFLEEDWFFEAVVETYVPLLSRFERLRCEGVPFRLTMTVTPPLCAMLGDQLLVLRLKTYIESRLDIIEKELNNNSSNHIGSLAYFYKEHFENVRNYLFNQYHGHLLQAFKSLQDSGHLELITCTATHGFLPLMSSISAIRAQVKSAVKQHTMTFGKAPRGIWLAECGYDDRVAPILAEAGLEYFFLDSHGILFGDPQPVDGVYAPVVTTYGVSAFARDPESSKQVWSSKEGYPGDPSYREFYRDLGYDAEYDYIKPYLHSDGIRRGIGIKYHRITGSCGLHEKQYYEPERAFEKAAEHAGNFLFNRQAQVQHLNGKTTNPPIIISPYDAELFGHWWFEGPQFLEMFIRKCYFDQATVKMVTPGEYLDLYPVRQLQRPNPSTWGSEGHNLVWLNGGNSWIYRHQHWAEQKMEELATRFESAGGDLKRALNQMLRELLLLQSSDWAFIMTTGTTVSYATKRFREHLDRFKQLSHQIESQSINLDYLKFLETTDCMFPAIEFSDSALKTRQMEEIY
ncbi:MAG: glycoside hydrolase family 57 protein [Elusimicrobiota bacterium]